MPLLPSDQDSTGRSFGGEEIELLTRVIESGTLFAPKGTYVKELESRFAGWLGTGHAIACSSGTAAVHTAIAGLDLEPGDEIITTSITDIGGLTPILYQGAIPVFADVDGDTGNVTAATVAKRITDRTRAIIVTHLFGNPVDVGAVADIAGDIPIIEDCAQAFGATVGGEPVGTLGAVGTFSLQQGKHITSGEGGIVISSDPDLAKRMRLFVNKAWDYDDPSDHDFLALNYRMSELAGAVSLAQLDRLDEGVATRRRNAARLGATVAELVGVRPTTAIEPAEPSFWRYCLLVDPGVIPGGTDALAAKLRGLGVPAAPRYIKKPAYKTGLFQNRRTFGQSSWPFSLASEDALDYSDDRFTGTLRFLERVLVLPWNERLVTSHIDQMAEAMATGVGELRREAA